MTAGPISSGGAQAAPRPSSVTAERAATISVLLVEDNFDLAQTVAQLLELEGITVEHAYHGAGGLKLAAEGHHDVIILDVMLPKMSGLDVCRQLREQGVDTPVLMLTALSALNEKLAGFDSGTDDYLTKPFEPEELVARVKALAQRRSSNSRLLTVGPLSLDLDSRQAKRGERKLKLTPTGWVLLELFMRNAPQVVERAALEARLWGDEPAPAGSLRVHIHKLRRQVDAEGEPPMLQTISGLGHALRIP